MAIDPTTGTGASAAVTPPATDAKKPDPLGKDAFMSLLLEQLKNQDPTSPQDNGAFLAQLAQFSSLEQLQTANGTLSTIAGFFTQIQTPPAADSTTPPVGGN